jgi:hypothetical protein
VEAAAVLMIFFVFLMAILEFGRAYNIYQVMTNAAREGARFAVAPCSQSPGSCSYGGGTAGALPTVSEVRDRVNGFLASANIPTTGPDVHVYVCRSGDPGDCSSIGGTIPCDTTMPVHHVLCDTVVQVSAPYKFIFMQVTGINASVTMKAQARMRDETN